MHLCSFCQIFLFVSLSTKKKKLHLWDKKKEKDDLVPVYGNKKSIQWSIKILAT